MQIWKDIHGYEGLYQVSDMGLVKSLGRIVDAPHGNKRIVEERILMQKIDKRKGKGYMRVHLSKMGKAKWLTVHRLVAKAHIPNPLNLPEINHKSGIKNDNRASELEWCTREFNENHAVLNNLKASGYRNHMFRVGKGEVGEILKMYQNGLSGRKIALKFGVGRSLVYNIIKGDHWTQKV